MPDHPAQTASAVPPFNLRALLADRESDPLPLLESHINPAFARVLKTIGFDIRYARGQGAYLFDEAGTRYIDCLGGYAVFNLGRNHPAIRDALKQAMDLDLPNLPGVGPFRTAGLLARELTKIAPGARTVKSGGGAGSAAGDGAVRDDVVPGPLDTVYFCNSGAEAIEAAIKHARAFTGRDRIVYCRRAYHGLTMGALSVNGNHEFREPFGTLLTHTTEIAFNDLQALERELAKADVAAFIVEPIQGKGVNLPHDDYLPRAVELCQRHGALLIADEIQTGLGRTGKMWAWDHWSRNGSVLPDILCTAKALSGGYMPVGAVITRREVHESVFSCMERCSVQQTTFGMNDLSMVAGLATLHTMRCERTVEHAAEVGGYLMDRLRSRLSNFQMFRDVRGRGLMIGIEFGAPTSLGLRMGWNLLHKLDQSLFCQAILIPLLADHKILAQVAGHKLDVIKLIPPLVLSKQDAGDIAAAFEATVAACHQFPGPAWEVGKKLGAAAMKRYGRRDGQARNTQASEAGTRS